MKILHLNLKKKWFDMILSGEKKEEYREDKPHWRTRLLTKNGDWKTYDIIRFSNGYSKNRRQMDIDYLTPRFDTGNTDWGAEQNKVYFTLPIGTILSTKNV